MLRYSLLGLFLGVSLTAVFCAALAQPTDLWVRTALTLTVGILLAAMVAAIFGRGTSRPFAGGMAVVGMTLHVFVLPYDDFTMAPSSKLFSTSVLQWLFVATHGALPSDMAYPPGFRSISDVEEGDEAEARRIQAADHYAMYRRFMNIGNAAITIFASLVGGTFAVYCATRPRPASPMS
jgi:Mn2+/Fe2+ NRAMP family transporter